MKKTRKYFRGDEFELKNTKSRKIKLEQKVEKETLRAHQHRVNVASYPKNYKLKNPSPKNRNSNEVVVKITSGCKNYESVSRKIDYDTRNGELHLYTPDYLSFIGKEDNKIIKQNMRTDGGIIPKSGVRKRERRETYNMVFSLKGEAPKAQMLQSVMQTLGHLYPENFYTACVHTDTKNTHVHVMLKVTGKNGKRIHICKNDLANLRTTFAERLNSFGIEAKATRRKEREQSSPTLKESIDYKTAELQNANSIKRGYYQVVNFGEATYQNEPNAKQSFFVELISGEKKFTIWGEDLKRVIEENQVTKGEFAKFVITDYKEKQTSVKRRIGKRWVTQTKTSYGNVWDVSVLNRAEKDLRAAKKPQTKDEFNIELNQKERENFHANQRARYLRKSNAQKFRTRAFGENTLQQMPCGLLDYHNNRDFGMFLQNFRNSNLQQRQRREQFNRDVRRADDSNRRNGDVEI